MVESLIFDRLTANESLAEYVGGTVGSFGSGFSNGFASETSGRVFCVQPTINVGSLPFVVFTVVSTTPTMALDGPTGITTYAIDVECLAIDQADVEGMAEAVLEQLHGWRDLGQGVLWCRQTGGAETAVDERTRSYTLSFSLTTGD